MPEILPLTLADRSLVSGYLRSYPPEISEHTFTNLFIWQPSRPILFAEIDTSLIFLVKAAEGIGKYILFGPPIGFGRFRMSWTRSGTEYVLAWLPLGGFVKMLGENPDEIDSPANVDIALMCCSTLGLLCAGSNYV